MKKLTKFKEQLIADPKEALSKEFGIEFSDDVDVKVLFETEKTRYIVIPFKETELDESEIIRMGKGSCTTTSPRTNNTRC